MAVLLGILIVTNKGRIILMEIKNFTNYQVDLKEGEEVVAVIKTY